MHMIGVIGTVVCTLAGILVLRLTARIAAKLLARWSGRCGLEGCWRRSSYRFYDGRGPWFFLCDTCAKRRLGPGLERMVERGTVARVDFPSGKR